MLEFLAVLLGGWMIGVACAVWYLDSRHHTSPPPSQSIYTLTKKASQSRPRIIAKTEEQEAEIEARREQDKGILT